ncbi:glycosyltransferase family 4 protein [Sphingomonas sp. BN140010]|uniref:Glycosyltransferase family 4 protein n=1 Tax=Sphingomonas arvum TaxID=2992113 RepID=A0ABT3JDD2_9SPHN|nr:glycosyltransferase family 4 protein [Sphingomonas sp. BN140010]MCW3797073.1 glycosyltransferase family 4 protein [Sphingomonas sp. BN140010]
MSDHEQKPRLVVAANSFWNLRNFRGGLIRGLAGAGFALTLVAPDAENQAGLPGRGIALPMRSDGLNPLADTRLLSAFVALLKRERPVALLSWTAKPNIYGALAARLAGIPALPNVSGLGTAFIRGGLLQQLLSSLYRAAFARCPAVFFQNGEDLDLFVAKRLVRREQARLLPGSGVDLARFATHPMPADGGLLRLLFVGRLLGDKGVRELVAAARILKREQAPVSVQLLGFAGVANRTAITGAELEGWVRDGLVDYLGHADDVRPALAQAHGVVLPSYREGLPRSLLEAAAVGRPLLASDVPGCRDVVADEVNGYLFPVRSPEGLADAIRRWLRLSPAERAAMGEAARRTVEQRFSEEQVVTAYLRELDALVGQART